MIITADILNFRGILFAAQFSMIPLTCCSLKNTTARSLEIREYKVILKI